MAVDGLPSLGLLELLLLFAALPCAAAEPTHCKPTEQTVFNCTVRGGKVVSVCTSAEVSATVGYVQYRFGRPGKPEMLFPATLAGSQAQFALESHRPYQGESELLNFSSGGFEYSVYWAIGNDPEPFRSAGVSVSRYGAGGKPEHGDFKCLAVGNPRLGALAGVVRAQE